MHLANAAAIEEKSLNWLWPGLIPMGQDTIIEGDPGTAKSTLTLALAAHVSNGEDWPDGMPCQMGSVIIANGEDPEEEVIVPRLRAAGANLDNCHILVPTPGKDDDSFSIPESIPFLEAQIREMNVRLVVFDPIEAFLSSGVDNYRNHHVRKALRALELMAKRLNCSVVFVRHLNKDTNKAAIYRGGGSIGMIGAARAALSVGRDKANKERCIVVPVKQNWTKMRGGIAYKPVEVKYVTGKGELITTSKIVWDGEVDVTADDVITAESEATEIGATEEAAGFLQDELSGGAKKANEIFSAASGAGIARKTLWRASKLLGIIKRKEGFGTEGQWVWELPDHNDLLNFDQLAKGLGIEVGQEI